MARNWQLLLYICISHAFGMQLSLDACARVTVFVSLCLFSTVLQDKLQMRHAHTVHILVVTPVYAGLTLTT